MAAKALDWTVQSQDLEVAEAVLEIAVEQLDWALTMLKQHARREDLCVFLLRRIAGAPDSELEELTTLYIRHFNWRGLQDSPPASDSKRKWFKGWIEDVPEEIAACEFECPRSNCLQGEWETCPNRLRG